MSGLVPLIADWTEKGLSWIYVQNESGTAVVVPPGGEIDLPNVDGYTYPEGVLLEVIATFDSTLCGVRIEAEPLLDTQQRFRIDRIASEIDQPEPLYYAIQPPACPIGRYSIRICSPTVFRTTLRIHLFNADVVAHNCFRYYYRLAALTGSRAGPGAPTTLEGLSRLIEVMRWKLILEAYPERIEEIRDALILILRELLPADPKETADKTRPPKAEPGIDPYDP